MPVWRIRQLLTRLYLQPFDLELARVNFAGYEYRCGVSYWPVDAIAVIIAYFLSFVPRFSSFNKPGWRHVDEHGRNRGKQHNCFDCCHGQFPFDF